MAALARRPARRSRTWRPLRANPGGRSVPTISADDIGSYVNANLGRLERFIDRELHFRCADEEIPEDALSTRKSSTKSSPARLATRTARKNCRSNPGFIASLCKP